MECVILHAFGNISVKSIWKTIFVYSYTKKNTKSV